MKNLTVFFLSFDRYPLFLYFVKLNINTSQFVCGISIHTWFIVFCFAENIAKGIVNFIFVSFTSNKIVYPPEDRHEINSTINDDIKCALFMLQYQQLSLCKVAQLV